MKRYQPKNLSILCGKIIALEYKKQNKRISLEKLTEKASNTAKQLVKEAHEEIDKNLKQYTHILLNPEELFYFKKQKTDISFYKEYLEDAIVKKYAKYLKDIFLTQTTIEELDKTTEIFTKGKFKTFNKYFYAAFLNRKEKLANQIAIQKIEKTKHIKYLD